MPKIPSAPSWDFDDDDEVEEYEPGPTFTIGGETFHCMAVPPLGAIWRLEGTNIIDRKRGVVLSAVPDAIGFVDDCLAIELPQEPQPPRPVAGDAAVVDEGAEPGPEPAPDPDAVIAAAGGRWVGDLYLSPCDDVARWKALVDDKRRTYKAEKVGEIVARLYSWYGNRPTNAS